MRKVDRKVKMMPGPAENKAGPVSAAAKEEAENGGKKKPAGGKRADHA